MVVMFRRLNFGSIRGIPITASGSWLFVVFVLIWFVGGRLYEMAEISRTASVLLATLTVALFFGSVVAHELGHAFAALRAGLKVDGIELWMFGGFARLSEAPRTPGEQFRIAIAGPLVSLVLTILFVGGVVLIDPDGFSDAANAERANPYVAVATLIGVLNFAVFVLNLLPAYPLDGGVIARALAWRLTGDPHRATRYAALAGLGIGVGLILVGMVLLWTDESQSDGFSIALLGWLVAIAARGSFDSARRQERLDLVTVGAIADPSISAVEGHHTVLSATDAGGPPGQWVVVRSDDAPPALLSASAIMESLAKGQPALTLAELAAEQGDRTIAGDTSLREFMLDPRLREGPLLAIGTQGQPLGLVTGPMLQRAVVVPSRTR
jgi:Zn-dependent protease